MRKTILNAPVTLAHIGRMVMYLLFILCTVIGSGQRVLGQGGVFSINNSSIDELNDSLFIQKMRFCDSEGKSYNYEELLLKKQLDYTYYECSNPSSVFNVVFEDSPDINFLESTGTRDVICQVFTDMSALLMLQSSVCYPLNQKATIIIREESLPLGVAARAGIIYSWRADEYSADGQIETGIVDNLAWLAINGHSVSQIQHGTISFDPLNNGFLWNIDNTVSTISNNSVDLYSTTLHELLHVLGFDSAIASNGESTLFSDPANSPALLNTNLYTRYDTYLKNSVNNNLVQNSDIVGNPYNWNFAGAAGDLTAINGCSVTFQDVASSSSSPIFTPTNFTNNQSLKHLLNTCTTPYPNYVMDPVVQGVVHRVPTVEEINMLCALGYRTTGIYGNQTVTAPCFKQIPVGRIEYGTNCVPWEERFKITMCPGQESIDILYSDILYNDINVVGGTTTIVGLNVCDITQPMLEVTVTPYANYFTVTAQNTGIIDIDNAEITLKYIPVTTMSNGDILYGNISYVNILLKSCCYPIIPSYQLTGCNLIPNPTLVIADESNCNQNMYILNHNIGNYNYCVAGWGRLRHRPGCVPVSMLQEEATNVWNLPNLLTPTGYNMIRQKSIGTIPEDGSIGANEQEISITEVPVMAQKNYILSFLLFAANGDQQDYTLDDYEIYLINSVDIQQDCNYQQAPTQQIFTLPSPINYPIKQGVSCFTATQNWSNLFFKPISNSSQVLVSFMTRPTLVEDIDKINFENLNNTTTYATYICNDNDNTITLFDPNLCHDITIAYTVTGTNGFSKVFTNEPLVVPIPDCTTNYTITRSIVPWNTDYPDVQEVYDLMISDNESQNLCSPPITITVDVQQATNDVFTLSENNVCVGESITITANSNFSNTTEHLYIDSEEVIADINSQYVYTPTTSGIVQVDFTWSNSGCCAATYTQNITINPLPNASISGITTICSGNSTTLTATGGGTYTWSNAASTQSISVSTAGTYTVTVTNAQGCSATASATVVVNPITTTATQPTCGMNNGSISVTPTNGTYAWTGGLSGSNPTGVAAGTYTVTVTSGGCQATTSVTLNSSSALIATATLTQPTCGMNNGSISVTPTNGTYAWTGGLSGSNPTGVAAGTYTVTVTSGGCQATTSVTLSPSQAATANISGITTICSGNSTTLTATGGGTYIWSNGLGTGASISGSPTSTSTYTVTVTATNGCTATATKTVTVNALPTASISGVASFCAGSSAILTATGGGTYLWSNSLGTNSAATVTTAGTYTVTVTSVAGCTKTATKTVTVNPLPNASISGITTICSGNSTTLTATGGSTYSWSNGANAAATSITTAGTYTVTVTNAQGCTASAAATVVVNLSPTVSIFGNTTICAGETTTLSTTVPLGGIVNYVWSNGNAGVSNTVNTASIYTVTVTALNGCTATATTNVTVNPTPNITISTACLNNQVQLNAAGGTQYVWNTGATNATILVPPTIGTSFGVTGDNAFGCANSASITLSNAQTNCPCVAPPNFVDLTANSSTISLSQLVTSGILPAASATNASVFINGTLVVDQSYTFVDSQIAMGPDATIRITNSFLRLTGTHVFAPCQFLWNSIVAETGTGFISEASGTTPTRIEDGIYAVTAHDNTRIDIKNTIFENNFIGFYVPQNDGIFQSVEFASGCFGECQFIQTANILPSLTASPVATVHDALLNGNVVIPNTHTWAGICVNDLKTISIAGKLDSDDSNSFSLFHHLTKGIVADHLGTINVSHCRFEDILQRNTYPSVMIEGCGIFASRTQLTQGGMGEDMYSFKNCHVGVKSLRARLAVGKNLMEQMYAGVVALLNINADEDIIIGGNIIRCSDPSAPLLYATAARRGINLLNNQNMNITIAHNNITLNHAPNDHAIGIEIVQIGTVPSTTIYENEIDVLQGRMGIRCLNTQNVHIRENALRFHIPNPTDQQGNPLAAQFGIRVEGGGKDRLNCNDIQFVGGGTAANNRVVGIQVNAHVKGAYSCNLLNNTHIGMRFVDFCGNSTLRGNNFGNHHTGLQLSQTAIIGQQNHQGNTWTGTYSQVAAWHESNDPFLIQASRFFVTNTFMPPSIGFGTPMQLFNPGWFVPLPSDNIFSCGEYPDCYSLLAQQEVSFNSTDKKFATNEINFTAFEEDLNRAGDRDVYEKLRENPDLLNSQPIALNFKVTMDTTTTANLYDIKQAAEAQLNGSDALKNLLLDNQTATDLVMQQLAINDSLHYIATANWADLEAERAELKTQLYSLLADKENLLALLSDERNTVAEQIKQQNEVIAANAETRLLNEKIINSIYLAMAARGDFDFDTESLQQIIDIANQCPITGGQAVYVARGLYETIEPTIYDDEAICQAIGISQKTEEPICATDFDIVPNPSKGIVSFVLNKPQDATILIYDALGRQVAQYKLNNESSITTFDLSYLASGIYFIQLQSQQNNSQIQKLSLIH